MSLLAPLGLLGLIGLIVLIIIYIIKPNYQSKFISSTFIWKLSLKYKKKKIPLSKLRNILLFICQVLILTAAALILSQPFLDEGLVKEGGETIIVIDASASMQSTVNEETRLERAVNQALADAREALEKDKKVTVIVAADEASFLVQQVGRDQAQLVYDMFDDLSFFPENYTTYGTPDIEGAMKLAEQITSYSKDAVVTLYTDTTYLNCGDVKIYDVKDPAEWNASILDVRATIVENYYRIEIDVACYGADSRLLVNCEIFDVNETGTSLSLEQDVYCSGDEVTTLVFAYIPDDMSQVEADLIDQSISVFAYDYIYVYVSAYDSLEDDNIFYLYGGIRPTIKVQYYSTLPNNYWSTALLVLQDAFANKWIIDIDEVTAEPATEGYDIYIFEHTMPTTVPSDGLVIFVNPDRLPTTAGVRLGSTMTSANGEIFLEAGEPHKMLQGVNVGAISVTQFKAITSYDGYTPLATIGEHPLLLVKEEVDQKIMLLPFSLHYSNLPIVSEFPVLLYNAINHFFPMTIEDHVFDINDTVKIHARATSLDIMGPGTMLTYEEFPVELTVTAPGTYTLTQTPISGTPVIESIYVRIPNVESDINLTEATLVNPYFYTDADSNAVDLLFYFALALVALLFLEWWLKSREQI